MLQDRKRLIRKLFKRIENRRAHAYLARQGVTAVLKRGFEGEIPPVVYDLSNMHRIVRRRRPKTILEFGVGFSTIAMAMALHQNYEQDRSTHGSETTPKPGRLWSVDAGRDWIENVKNKIPDHLRPYVEFRHSEVEARLHEGELCHMYKDLPNVVPDFVYLDAPDPRDVKGAVNGLSYTLETGGVRQVAAADLLLYESSLKRGFFMLIDARYNNMHFLHRHLKRNYRVTVNRVHNVSTFELLEHTGRH
ncbi:MAG: hypothetical protein WEB85_01870 [Dongiaceae bacterium]